MPTVIQVSFPGTEGKRIFLLNRFLIILQNDVIMKFREYGYFQKVFELRFSNSNDAEKTFKYLTLLMKSDPPEIIDLDILIKNPEEYITNFWSKKNS